jgi:hypothetical protein
MSTPVVGSVGASLSQTAKAKSISRTKSSGKTNGDPTYKKPRTRDTKGRFGAGADSATSSSVDAPTRISRPRRSRTRQMSPEDISHAGDTPSSSQPHNHGHVHPNGGRHSAPWDGPPLQLPLMQMAVTPHPHPVQSPPTHAEPDHRWTSGGPHYIAAHFVQEEPWAHPHPHRVHLPPPHPDEARRERSSPETHHDMPSQASRHPRADQDDRRLDHFGGNRAGRTIYSEARK